MFMSKMEAPRAKKKWNAEASRILKARLVRDGVSYADLAHRLRARGADETQASIANKLSRGTFSFAFYLQCVAALDQSESIEMSVRSSTRDIK